MHAHCKIPDTIHTTASRRAGVVSSSSLGSRAPGTAARAFKRNELAINLAAHLPEAAEEARRACFNSRQQDPKDRLILTALLPPSGKIASGAGPGDALRERYDFRRRHMYKARAAGEPGDDVARYYWIECITSNDT